MRDEARHSRTRDEARDTIALLHEEPGAVTTDDRLGLILAASHPAISGTVHAPLILQTVFGVSAAEMALVFLVPASTIGQRLVRAKAKIKAAGIPFDADPARLPERLTRALDALYALYTMASAAPSPEGGARLAVDALHLSRLIARLAPDDPEALGLAALVAFAEARRPARRDAAGDYVPLSRQDAASWDAGLIEVAEASLAAASRHRRIGPYQLQAAIQSAHCERIRNRTPEWAAIAALYDALTALTPSIGAIVAKAAAYAEAHGPAAGLAVLDGIDRRLAGGYQPYWAVRAHLQTRAGHSCAHAYARAIELANDGAVRAHLQTLQDGQSGKNFVKPPA